MTWDSLLHSDNDLDIPTLDLGWQATDIVPPVIAWGSMGRSLAMPGTYHLYVDDSKFSGLLSNPDKVIASGCSAVCEPNISLFDHSTRYYAIWAVGRKRASAAVCGKANVKLLVDLNVPERFTEDNLVGVPKGWNAYSTRGYSARPCDLIREYEVAKRHAGATPLMLVVGGGDWIREMCRGLPGTIHVSSSLGSANAKRAMVTHGKG